MNKGKPRHGMNKGKARHGMNKGKAGRVLMQVRKHGEREAQGGVAREHGEARGLEIRWSKIYKLVQERGTRRRATRRRATRSVPGPVFEQLQGITT